MTKIISKFIFGILFFSFLEILVFLIVRQYDALFGVIIGTGGSIINVISLARDVEKMGYLSKKWVGGYAARYLLAAALFLLSGMIMSNKLMALSGCFIGLMNVKLAAYVVGRWID